MRISLLFISVTGLITRVNPKSMEVPTWAYYSFGGGVVVIGLLIFFLHTFVLQ